MDEEVVSSSTHYRDKNLIFMYESGGAKLYDLPAGSLEDDEEPLSGMIREFQEETGLEQNDIRKITALRPYTYCMDDKDFKVYPYDIEVKGTARCKSIEAEEHLNYEWAEPDRIKGLGVNGTLALPKFFNLKYIEHGLNTGHDKLRGNEDSGSLFFTDEEVKDHRDNLESLIEAKLDSISDS